MRTLRGMFRRGPTSAAAPPDSRFGTMPTRGSWYRARGPRFEETRLQNGMKAPDIVGVDLFGEEFRLSDYAGKVVMLDFWGDW
jgi:hypothetical protein